MRTYLCIDLKSFYASVECVELGLDPLGADLVVADPNRGEGTICLAVSSSLKKKGVKNRCRVFEIARGLNYIKAPPRMELYIKYSSLIYNLYLNYVCADDIHIYSIDEAFLDVTNYLKYYNCDGLKLGKKIIADIYDTFGLYASCGVGTNLYLCKVALDILAKNSVDNIAYLDEDTYKTKLWNHEPLNDFWMIGNGKMKRLNEKLGLYTMAQIANCDQDKIYCEFGVDGELLIDHAWGREDITISDVKNYRSKTHSINNGQVLLRNYNKSEALIVIKEMTLESCFKLLKQHLVCKEVNVWVGYDYRSKFGASGKTVKLEVGTSSSESIVKEVEKIFKKIVLDDVPIRNLGISLGVVNEGYEFCDLFVDENSKEKNRRLNSAIFDIKRRFGNNSLLNLMDLQDGATAIERNNQIGGHQKNYRHLLKYGEIYGQKTTC